MGGEVTSGDSNDGHTAHFSMWNKHTCFSSLSLLLSFKYFRSLDQPSFKLSIFFLTFLPLPFLDPKGASPVSQKEKKKHTRSLRSKVHRATHSL